MSTATALASIGDNAFMNVPLSQALSEIWIDRDLSWLDFNARVLAEAVDARTPLLERVKFLAIFTSNLDEFFMKRMAVLRYLRTGERNPLVRQIREKFNSNAAAPGRLLAADPDSRTRQAQNFPADVAGTNAGSATRRVQLPRGSEQKEAETPPTALVPISS